MNATDSREWERTKHTFKPWGHGTAQCTCPHFRRYVEWSGREWASRPGPSFDLGGIETIERYRNVE